MDFNKFSTTHKRNGIYDCIIKPENILNELKQEKSRRDFSTFQKLLANRSGTFDNTWEPVLLELLNLIVNNEEENLDKKKLASQVFFVIIAGSHCIDDQMDYLRQMLLLDSCRLFIFNTEINVLDVESFRLIIVHGFLSASDKLTLTSSFFTLSFDIIQEYCMIYTKHIYFAFKLLEMWLKKSRMIDFWSGNDVMIEENLKIIILSNLDNCISEVAKINASNIFPEYLEIMRDKYEGFLQCLLQTTIENLSWQSPNKFIIIAEICKAGLVYPAVLHLESNIFQSITKSHLKHAGTKLYLTLLSSSKMDLEQWDKVLRSQVFENAKKWESENNSAALQILWELWMKPTLIKFREELIPSLWTQFCIEETMISATYLLKITSELGLTWKLLVSKSEENSTEAHRRAMQKYWSEYQVIKIPLIVDVTDEYATLNIFVACCRMEDFLNEANNYAICKSILYFNANSCSTHFRKGIFDNFKILVERIMKKCGNTEISFIYWLHDFIFDCFEPGSCYQRKIIGLKLYEISAKYIDEIMKKSPNWSEIKKFTLHIFLRLCTDPIEEIREHAFNIIIKFFTKDNFTEREIKILMEKAMEMNKSSKFYEIAGGVKLTLIANEYQTELFCPQLHERLLRSASSNLAEMKTDLLCALTRGSDFNASLITLFELNLEEPLRNSPSNFTQQLLSLMEDSTKFFLLTLSPKSKDVIYSSSFAEMGVAIEEIIKTSRVMYEYDENVVSPAHQIVLSCIWMALKTLCDLAAKIITLTNFPNDIERAIHLIVTVLLKCRHKGAIEAAGVALSVAIRYLAGKTQYYSIIDSYLDRLLNLNSKNIIDLTRRGAGMSILFHKMICNDNKKPRRLLHRAMNKLLTSLHDPAMESLVEDENQDCVCARQLHFLRTIVADKTLHPHLVTYMETISLICFKYLQSHKWAIRNASLQLLGALIPRLVGQFPENDIDFGIGYSINHFHTHYPALAESVLQKVSDPSAFGFESSIVPIITLISKMSVSGCGFMDHSSYQYIEKLKKAIRQLFGHSVNHVRHVAAKAYAALTQLCEITQELFNMKTTNLDGKSRNFIHGHLMAQIYLSSLAKHTGILLNTFPYSQENIKNLMDINEVEIERLQKLISYWMDSEENFDKNKLCNIIEITFIQSLRAVPFWDGMDKKSYKLISFSQFITITEHVSMTNAIGASEFIDNLFELDPFIAEPLDFDYIMKCSKSDYLDVRYYSMKYLHRKLIEMQNAGSEIINFFSDLCKLLSINISIQDCNEITVIETCGIIISALNQIKNWDSFSSSDSCSHQYLKLFLDTKDSLLEYAQCNKNKKIQYLTHKMSLLISIITSSPPDYGVVDYMKTLVYNFDEQKRIKAIDLLMDLNYISHKFYSDDSLRKFLLESFIELLSDENGKVRQALHDEIQKSTCPCDWYYTGCLTESKKYLFPKNVQLILHNAIAKLAPGDHLSSLLGDSKWMPRFLGSESMKDKFELESPFDEDETHREITKTFNIYYSSMDKISGVMPYSYGHVLRDEIISCSSRFLFKYVNYLGAVDNHDKMNAILNFKVSDYINYKASIYKDSMSFRVHQNKTLNKF